MSEAQPPTWLKYAMDLKPPRRRPSWTASGILLLVGLILVAIMLAWTLAVTRWTSACMMAPLASISSVCTEPWFVRIVP